MVETHRTQYLKKKGLNPKESYGLDDLSRISKIPQKILQSVFDRGIGAWKTNSASVRQAKDPSKRGGARSNLMTADQWAYARVYSFLNKGRTYYSADGDLAEKVKNMKKK
jgi:hypothetical protein